MSLAAESIKCGYSKWRDIESKIKMVAYQKTNPSCAPLTITGSVKTNLGLKYISVTGRLTDGSE